jgi:4-amino-4-deoxy-L-arabinose transferase-like glycosyltransferase
MIKSIYENRYFGVILIFILSLPVIFINRQISTDWGGDFAMYINEALNIAHFKQVTATHYVYNENAPMLGPEFYPVGFPLLLAPVCLLFGNNIPVLIIYMSLILVITATVLFLFFREYFSVPVAVILTLIIVYNPWTLIFKNEILADIPFTLFFVLTQLLYLRKAPAWITGTVMGFTVLIKTAGFVLPAGFVLYYLYILIKRKNRYKELVFPVFYALILVLTVNVLIFKIPSGPGLYSGNFNFTAFKHNFLLNVSLYIEIFQSFFYRILDDWKFLMLITQSVMLTFLLIGIINAKKNLIFFVFVTYLLLLFVLF